MTMTHRLQKMNKIDSRHQRELSSWIGHELFAIKFCLTNLKIGLPTALIRRRTGHPNPWNANVFNPNHTLNQFPFKRHNMCHHKNQHPL